MPALFVTIIICAAMPVSLVLSGSRECPRPFTETSAGLCYYFSTGFRTNWFLAAEYCRRIGSVLATPRTREEIDGMNDYYKTSQAGRSWLGGTDLGDEGKWIWESTLTPVRGRFWAKGQPDNHDGVQHCMMGMFGDYDGWMDETCMENATFVCQKDYQTCRTNRGLIKPDVEVKTGSTVRWRKVRSAQEPLRNLPVEVEFNLRADMHTLRADHHQLRADTYDFMGQNGSSQIDGDSYRQNISNNRQNTNSFRDSILNHTNSRNMNVAIAQQVDTSEYRYNISNYRRDIQCFRDLINGNTTNCFFPSDSTTSSTSFTSLPPPPPPPPITTSTAPPHTVSPPSTFGPDVTTRPPFTDTASPSSSGPITSTTSQGGSSSTTMSSPVTAPPTTINAGTTRINSPTPEPTYTMLPFTSEIPPTSKPTSSSAPDTSQYPPTTSSSSAKLPTTTYVEPSKSSAGTYSTPIPTTELTPSAHTLPFTPTVRPSSSTNELPYTTGVMTSEVPISTTSSVTDPGTTTTVNPFPTVTVPDTSIDPNTIQPTNPPVGQSTTASPPTTSASGNTDGTTASGRPITTTTTGSSVTSPRPPKPPSGCCPPRFVPLVSGTCYLFSGEFKATFNESIVYCQNLGGILAEPRDSIEVFSITEYGLNTQVTGSHFVGATADWKWNSDGKPLDMAILGPRALQFSENDTCLTIEITADEMLWVPANCQSVLSFICSLETAPVDPESDIIPDVTTALPPTAILPQHNCPEPFIWLGPKETYCYFFSTGGTMEANWFKANEFCSTINGNLLTIDDEEEFGVIQKYLLDIPNAATNYYIGGYDLGHEGVWYWVSTRKVIAFTKWIKNQPDNAGYDGHEDCLALAKPNEFSWNDVLCTRNLDFICERINDDL